MIIIDGDDGSGDNGAGIKIGRGITMSSNAVPYGEAVFNAVYPAGVIENNSLLFNNTSGSWLSVPANSNIDLYTGPWTMECWVWLNTATNHTIWSMGTYGVTTNSWLYINSSGQIQWEWNPYNSWGWIYRNHVIANSSIPTKTWTHIAVVREYGLTIAFFVNGKLISEIMPDSNPAIPNDNCDIYIGSYFGNGGWDFNGMMSNFRLTNKIVYNYSAGAAGLVLPLPGRFGTRGESPAGFNVDDVVASEVILFFKDRVIDQSLNQYPTTNTQVTYSPQNPFDNSVSYTAIDKAAGLFTANATYLWTVPPGVTSISVLAIGGGGGGAGSSIPYPLHQDSSDQYAIPGSGGGGGALAYANNIAVVPGTTYIVQVGGGGGPKHFTQLLGTDWETTRLTTGNVDVPGSITLNNIIGGLQTARQGLQLIIAPNGNNWTTLGKLPFFLDGLSMTGSVNDRSTVDTDGNALTTQFSTSKPVRVYLYRNAVQWAKVPLSGWNPIIFNPNQSIQFPGSYGASTINAADLRLGDYWPEGILASDTGYPMLFYRDFKPGTYELFMYSAIYFFDDRINPKGGDSYLTTAVIKSANQTPLLFAGGGEAGRVLNVPDGYTFDAPGWKLGLAGGGGGAGGYNGAGGNGFGSGSYMAGGAGGAVAGSKKTGGFAGGAGGGSAFDTSMSIYSAGPTVLNSPPGSLPIGADGGITGPTTWVYTNTDSGKYTTTVNILGASGVAPVKGSGAGGGGGLNLATLMDPWQFVSRSAGASGAQYVPMGDKQFVAWGGGGVGMGGLGPDGIGGPVTSQPYQAPTTGNVALTSQRYAPGGSPSDPMGIYGPWRSVLRQVSKMSGSGGYEGVYDPNPEGDPSADIDLDLTLLGSLAGPTSFKFQWGRFVNTTPYINLKKHIYTSDRALGSEVLTTLGNQPASFFNTPGSIVLSKHQIPDSGNTTYDAYDYMMEWTNFSITNGAWYGGGGGGHYGNDNYSPVNTVSIDNSSEVDQSYPKNINTGGSYGGPGVVRIVWPGITRQFPNTRVQIPATPTQTMPIECFVVAGGGGGGGGNTLTVGGGGGGGGGVKLLTRTILRNQLFRMEVGAGGGGGFENYAGTGTNGNDSTIFAGVGDDAIVGYSVRGGGGGGAYGSTTYNIGQAGGSGGGGTVYRSGTTVTRSMAVLGQGNPGGNYTAQSGTWAYAAGGGGAGSPGFSPGRTVSVTGNGSGGGSGGGSGSSGGTVGSLGGAPIAGQGYAGGGDPNGYGYGGAGGGGAGGTGFSVAPTNYTNSILWSTLSLVGLDDNYGGQWQNHSSGGWSGFVNGYGVGNHNSHDRDLSFNVVITFPYTGRYLVQFACDDYVSLSMVPNRPIAGAPDSIYIGAASSWTDNTPPQTYIYVIAGDWLLMAGATNYAGPGQVAVVIQQLYLPGGHAPDGGIGATTNLITTSTATSANVGQVYNGSVYFAGGGGGGEAWNGVYCSSALNGLGGIGGGGAGGESVTHTPGWGFNGNVNTGGGGGGAGDYYYWWGGAGGSGVVIVSYPDTYSAAANTSGSPVYTVSSGKKIYIFKTSGMIKFTGTNTPPTVDYLIVAGGGSGGGQRGGGGGGGGFLTGTEPVMAGAENLVMVGAGAASRNNYSISNGNYNLGGGWQGSNSQFGTVIASGGGGGGSSVANLGDYVMSGDGGYGVSLDILKTGTTQIWGSGGGGGGSTYNTYFGPGVGNQGVDYDTGVVTSYRDTNTDVFWPFALVGPGNGGSCRPSDYDTRVDYRVGNPGAQNTGGGGGGSGYVKTGGSGGSGTIIVRYSTDYPEATVTGLVGYRVVDKTRIYWFQSSGTIMFN
jgi:hypothetical protein